MLGTRKSETMYLIKDLPFVQRIVGGILAFAGIGLLIWQNVNSVGTGTYSTAVLVIISIGLIGLGLFFLHKAPTSVTIINKELRAITIIEHGLLASTTSQFGFAEIIGDLVVDESRKFGGLWSSYRILLPVKDSVLLRVSSRTCVFPEIYFEAVAEQTHS